MVVRKFDRIPRFDDRSRKFSVSPLLTHKEPRSYTWRVKATLDQGSDGACVGFAWAHELVARPVELMEAANYDTAFSLYRAAQQIDYWPGEDYEGTSVLAGAKVLHKRGFLDEYRWSFTLEDTLATVSRHGPAVIGVNWYSGMFYPDKNNLIHPVGTIVGGHALVLNGVSITRNTVKLHNSWGPGWGINGEAEMTWEEFDILIRQQGEVCIPVARRKGN